MPPLCVEPIVDPDPVSQEVKSTRIDKGKKTRECASILEASELQLLDALVSSSSPQGVILSQAVGSLWKNWGKIHFSR